MNLLDNASLVVTPNAYKVSKLYSIVPSDGTGDMTFSRTGDTATRVNSAGLIETVLANKPRLDYLGTTCPKLLIESQRTNLALYSEDFSNASWTTFKAEATVSANTTVAPDGNSTADSILTSSTANSFHYIQQRTGSATAGTTYTMSCYVKKLGYDYCRLQLSDAGNGIAIFRFSTKTLTLSSTQVVANSGRVDEMPNGWFRISFSIIPSTSTAWRWWIIPLNDAGQDTFTGDITKGLYVWGFQMEVGSYVSSYIPTTTASVTRNADQCYDNSATSLIGQTEGTIFIDFELNNVGDTDTRNIITLGLFGALYTDRIVISQSAIASGTKYRFQLRANNTALLDDLTLNYTSGRTKMAVKYNSSSMQVFLNGVLVKSFTFTSTAFSTSLTTVYLGNFTNVNQPNTHKINSASLWKTRLTDQELITLTTL